MSTKRLFSVSFLLAILYSSASAVYFSGDLMLASPSSIVGQALQWIFMLPALIVFGVGYGEGEGAALMSAVIVFLIIWVLCVAVVSLLYPVVIRIKKKLTM
jgi:hypothetical protein